MISLALLALVTALAGWYSYWALAREISSLKARTDVLSSLLEEEREARHRDAEAVAQWCLLLGEEVRRVGARRSVGFFAVSGKGEN